MSFFERFHNKIYNKKIFVLFTWSTRILLFLGFLPSGLKKLIGERFTLLGLDSPVGFFFEALYRTGYYWNYLGFMQYEGNNYQEANKYFQKVEGEEKYSDKLSYFKADMAFKEGSFQKAIDAGLAAMPKSNASEKSELNKIIGESYFNLQQYDKALPYLKEYTKI